MKSFIPKIKQARFSHQFCGVLITFCLIILSGYWMSRLSAMADLEEATLLEMEHRADVLTAAVSEQTRGAIYNLDLGLLNLVHHYSRVGVITEREIKDVLDSTPPGLVRRITVIDRNGRTVLTYPYAENGVVLADRQYFKAHAAEGFQGLYIDRPVQSRIDHAWVIPISRKLTDRQGGFDGVIALATSPKYFADLYGRLTDGRDDVVALMLQDGAFLSRSLNLDEHMGKSARADRPFIGPQAAKIGGFRSISSHEPVDRIFAFRRLDEWPLVTVIGLGVKESLAPIKAGARRDNWSAIAVSLLVLLLVIGICVVISRLERSLALARESDGRRAMAFAGADELAWEWDVVGRRMRFFGDCMPFFGIPVDERRMAVDEWMPLLHPDDAESVFQASSDFLRNDDETIELRFRLRCGDGEYRWVLVRGQKTAVDDSGKVSRALGIMMDIDADHQAGVDAAKTKEAYRRLIESVAEAIIVVDQTGAIQLMNPAAELLVGWTADEAFEKNAHALLHLPAGNSPFVGDQSCPVIATLRDGMSRRGIRLTYRHKAGHEVPVEVSVAPIVIESVVTGAVTVVADVSQRLTQEAELERLARTDGLTGLWNRRYFVEMLGRELHRASRETSPLSLLMIDIDHFKQVNDQYGHGAGDGVLITFAANFRSQLRLIDIIGRLGGEEFCVGLPGIGLAEAFRVAERMRSGLAKQAVDLGEEQIHCSVSIGVAEWDGNESFDSLLARADAALYNAKRKGRNRVEVNQRLIGADCA